MIKLGDNLAFEGGEKEPLNNTNRNIRHMKVSTLAGCLGLIYKSKSIESTTNEDL